jgi:hypothetical protein
VGSAGGECGTVSGRGGDVGVVRVRARGAAGGCAVSCPRKTKLGGAHVAVRGEGGGGLGRPEAKCPVGREAGGWAWEKEAAQEGRRGSGPVVGRTSRAEKRKEAGPKSLLGLKSKKVKENQFLIDFWIKVGLEIE